jgi:hypothetical protein
MAMQTTRRDGSAVTARPKPFSWSYSRLKNYEVCPKRYYHTDVAKEFNDGDDNEQLQWGNTVHAAMAARCKDGTPLPSGMEKFEPWAAKVLVGGGEIFTELDTAIDENFGEAPWFAARDGSGPKPWLRCKIDYVKKQGAIALLVDWKTGKIVEDSFQLGLSASCAFARWPDLQAIRTSFVWLKEDAESSEVFYRADMARMWRTLWPRVSALTSAHQSMNFPPTPSRMCRSWCKVTSCPNHGKTFS